MYRYVHVCIVCLFQNICHYVADLKYYIINYVVVNTQSCIHTYVPHVLCIYTVPVTPYKSCSVS